MPSVQPRRSRRVVDLLKLDAGGLLDEVDGIQQILNAKHPHFPGIGLLPGTIAANAGGRRRGSAAGIDID